MRRAALSLAIALVLAACGEGALAPVREDDPMLAGALAEPILVDPDLIGQNRANSAVAMPAQHGLVPTVDGGPEAVAAARSEALRQVGGPGRMRRAPEPREADGSLPAGSPVVARDCAGRARQTALWAAQMPAPFPVYPRGAVQQAAGTDAGGCALRVVNFVTPVPLGEVIDFYFTRARGAGYSARRTRHGGGEVLAGAKGRASYWVEARRLPSGHTEVDLVTAR